MVLLHFQDSCLRQSPVLNNRPPSLFRLAPSLLMSDHSGLIFFIKVWGVSRARLFPWPPRMFTHSASFKEACVTTRLTSGTFGFEDRGASGPRTATLAAPICQPFYRCFSGANLRAWNNENKILTSVRVGGKHPHQTLASGSLASTPAYSDSITIGIRT